MKEEINTMKFKDIFCLLNFAFERKIFIKYISRDGFKTKSYGVWKSDPLGIQIKS